MKEFKGSRLYIALGPSQVRRRLKGHGLGVKMVQSAGADLTVVVHTATGEHLSQLKQLFADVPVAESEAEINLARAARENPDACAAPPQSDDASQP